MRLILTRHGETLENKDGILQGWLPGYLSKTGKKQALLLANRLRFIKIDFIYTSDLNRCVETAKIIFRFHPFAKFIKEKLLRERGLGDFSGKKTFEADWDLLPGDILTNRPKGGEAFSDVWKRLKLFYKNIRAKYGDETLLIVAHGGSICLLEGIIRGLNLKESLAIPKLSNTAISEYDIDKKGNYEIILLNCEKHL